MTVDNLSFAPMLTKRQRQILNYLERFFQRHDYNPSVRQIAKHFRLSAPATIQQHIEALRAKGYLDENKQPISVTKNKKSSDLIQIPLLGTIAAGQPIEVFPHKEIIAVPKSKVPKSESFYALRVAGNSMIDESIQDGDIILIKAQHTAENGQKIVALIDNHEATLKKFYKERGFIRLQPANKNIEPIIIDNNREIVIQGIVIDIIKNERLNTNFSLEQGKNEALVKKYKKLPLNKIICGDALIKLKEIPDESCDVIIADPPYNIGKDFGNNQDKRELSEYILWCKKWINECIRIMKPTGTLFIYGFSEILAHLSVEIPINKRWLIWHYTNKNVASLNFWQRSHEAIICAWKDKPVFNRDEIREPYTEGFLNGAAGKIRKGTVGRFGKNGKETIYKAHEKGALPRDVIKIPALAGGAGMIERWFLCKTCNDVFAPIELKAHRSHNVVKHPTQKPLELSQKLIKSAVLKKDGVVLVPFVGTGSECIAAKELGQSYIGFEINPDYIRIAEKALTATRVTPQLF